MSKDQEQIYQDTETLKQQFQIFEQIMKNNRQMLEELGAFEKYNKKLRHLVDDLMMPYFLPDPFGNGTYKKMEPEKFTELLSTYSDLLQISDSLQAELKRKINEKKGDEAENILLMPLMETLKYAGSMMAKDVSFMAGLNPEGGIVLPEVMQEARTRKLSINQKKIDTVGGNLSSRIPITFTDDKGVEHKGFFTKDKIIRFKEETKNFLLEEIEKTDDSQDFKNLMKQYINTIFQYPEIADDPGVLSNLLHGTHGIQQEDGKKYLCTELAFNLFMQGAGIKAQFDHLAHPEAWSFFGKAPAKGQPDTRTELQKRNRAAFNEKFNIAEGTEKAMQNINNYFMQLAFPVSKNPKTKDLYLNYRLMSQMEGSSLYQRNSAMSAVANLLGIGRVVAHSENMTININGEEVSGVFMEQAKGEDLKRVIPGSKLDLMQGQGKIEGSTMQANKDLFSLQLLDYICNNIDRHTHNCLYQVEGNKVVGLQGIDNDRSFGTAVYKKDQDLKGYSYALNISQLVYVPQDLAAAIEHLDPKVLDLVLKGYQLSEAERQAAVKRLEQVKHAILHHEIITISDNEMDDKSYLKAYLRINGNKSPIGKALENFADRIRESKAQNVPQAEDHKAGEGKAEKEKKNHIKPLAPIQYTKAEYKKFSVQQANLEILEHNADELLKYKHNKEKFFHKDIQTLKTHHEGMLDTDKHVKFGSSQFGNLEKAVKNLSDVEKLAAMTIRENHFSRKFPHMLDEMLFNALTELRTAADAYLARKNPDKKKNPAEQNRYDYAVNLKELAENRIDSMKNFSIFEKNPNDTTKTVRYHQLKNYLTINAGRNIKDGREFIYRKMLKELERVDAAMFDQDALTQTELRTVYKDFLNAAGPNFDKVFQQILPEQYQEVTYEEADNVYSFMSSLNNISDKLKHIGNHGLITPEQYQLIYNSLRKLYDPQDIYSLHTNFESAAKAICATDFLNELASKSNTTPEEFEEQYQLAQSGQENRSRVTLSQRGRS